VRNLILVDTKSEIFQLEVMLSVRACSGAELALLSLYPTSPPPTEKGRVYI
jgi:hypothetical protein